ncbi:chloride channel protein [Insolitispirillum peregrinum]|uniref:chloride channel protein n=1 Tax=Insolitispirillum peregrinum TaxID=80876 RepID=UPI00361DDBBC
MSHRLRRLWQHPRYSMQVWLHRLLFWAGAVMVAVAAVSFEWLSSHGSALFKLALSWSPLLALIITPAGFVLVLWLTRRVFPGAQGSGIPQTIAATKLAHAEDRNAVLSLRIAVGKVVLTTIGLCAGASIGREGPTVQVGAAIMHTLGRWVRIPIQGIERTLILAGGAAGVAAAFNTPLAGVVFAIEELSRSFEERTSGTVLTTVIIAGITAIALMGNYTYFGHTSATLELATAWKPVLICGIGGGVIGGAFTRVLLAFARGLPGLMGGAIKTHPYAFAGLCGLGVALLGLISGNSIYGTGYEEARSILEGTSTLPGGFGVLKMLASALSYISGIPGGIFAPSLSIGAGLGGSLAPYLPAVPLGALAILGMVGYFTGVVQAPITAVVIVMEMTDGQALTLPLLATAMLAFGASRLVNTQPMYRTLAQSFLGTHSAPAPEEKTPGQK